MHSNAVNVEATTVDFKRLSDAVRATTSKYEKGIQSGVAGLQIDLVHGSARFTGANTLAVANGVHVPWQQLKEYDSPSHLDELLQGGGRAQEYYIEAQHIFIATGSSANTIPEAEDPQGLVDTSWEFFEWDSLPSEVAVVGSGYIAVELAGILNALGCATHLLVRGDRLLKNFDKETV